MHKTKTLIKERFPILVSLKRKIQGVLIYIQDLPLQFNSPNSIFFDIYQKNRWGDRESLSGPGSNLEQTEAIRKYLPKLIAELKVESLLDIPCGDFYWMSMVDLKIQYIGGDIVPELIERNQAQYGNSLRAFRQLDLIHDDLPKSNLILCRDCLVHLSFQHINKSIKNIKASGAKYLLTTTFINRQNNENIPTGRWRPLNLQKPPFNFPQPIILVDEKCPIEGFEDKNLGLWEIKDIPDVG